jgi:hypothetical protein
MRKFKENNQKLKAKVKQEKLKKTSFGAFIIHDNKSLKLSFMIFSALILLMYTLSFIFLDDTKQVTISFIGNNGYRILFVSWGFLTATLITQFIVRLYNTFLYHNAKSNNMLRIAYISLIACVLIPSMAGIPNIINRLHTVSAFMFVATCLLSLLFFVKQIINQNRILGYKTLIMYIAMLMPPFLALIIFGNSGVYEILFFVTLIAYLVVMYFFLKRSNFKIKQLKKRTHIIRYGNKKI